MHSTMRLVKHAGCCAIYSLPAKSSIEFCQARAMFVYREALRLQ
jgi:hypothetical protein